jgi:Tol biopolymer transport system component/DNA-binding winged helix-turn-helix (wHTH) protein
MSSPERHFYEFGPFRLDADERVLLIDGATVALTPKEIELLMALVRNAGRVVSKEELLREVWPDTFVSEKTLAQNVFTLRKALAREDAERQYVETAPRRGYRFCVPVREATGAPEREEIGKGAALVNVAASNQATSGGQEVPPEPRTAATPDAPRELIANGLDGARANGTNGTGGVNRAESESADESNVENAGANVDASVVGSKNDARAAETPTETTHAAGERIEENVALGRERAAMSIEEARRGHPVRDAFLIAAAILLLMTGLVYAVFRFAVRPRTTPRPPAFQAMKVTQLPVSGEVLEAAISPDGKFLAHIAPEANGRGMSIWVRQVSAASEARRIVEPEVTTFYIGLTFSHDGQHVLFGAQGPNNSSELRQVPAFGGAIRTILTGVGMPVSFSPDGRKVAYTRGQPPLSPISLYIADADGRNERKLAERTFPAVFGLPSWAPDGERVAFAYTTGVNASTGNPYIGIAVLNVSDGVETRVTQERWIGVSQLAWLPDGTGFVLNAAEQELSPSQLWEVSYPSGEVRRITNDLNSYVGASLTADGTAMVAVQTDRNPNIWVVPNGDASRARQVTSGKGRFDGYYGLSWMPDGRLVYASVASGSWDIWTMNADGTGQKQLTVGARSNYGPSVSPDGRYIVFLSNRAGSFNIWRMGLDGSNPVQLTRGPGENFPHITPDGRSVVYATYGFQQPGAIWKVSIDGGQPVRITDQPSSWPFVSPDGKFVACIYSPEPNSIGQLAVVPIDGGQPVKLFSIEPSFRANITWMPDNRGIAFLDVRSGTNNVWMQPLSGGEPVQLTNFTGAGVVAYDYTRDGKQLAVTRSTETTGVVLIRDFR